jgi:hypothetical protein
VGFVIACPFPGDGVASSVGVRRAAIQSIDSGVSIDGANDGTCHDLPQLLHLDATSS